MCDTTFASNSGQFASPNYPSEYGNNEDCPWTITVTAGMTVILSFSAFSVGTCTNCTCDSVKVLLINFIIIISLDVRILVNSCPSSM